MQSVSAPRPCRSNAPLLGHIGARILMRAETYSLHRARRPRLKSMIMQYSTFYSRYC